MTESVTGQPTSPQDTAVDRSLAVYERGLPPNKLHIREYAIPLEVRSQLTEAQRAIHEHLVDAVRLVAEPYRDQEGDGKATYFYPQDATKKEIREAAKKNPEILSEYTIVRRDPEDGSLVAVPMHEYYWDFLHKEDGVIDHLKKASELARKARDAQLFAYLRAKIQSLETGNYEGSEHAWLTMDEEPLIDIVIGFYDVYTDRRFKRKNALTGWSGLLNREITQVCQTEADRYVNWWSGKNQREAPIVKVRADETAVTAGQPAQYDWNGNSLPNQSELREKFGSKFTLFLPVYRDRLTQRLDTYKDIVEANTRRRLPLESLINGDLKRIVFHETSHSFDIPADLPERLEQHSDWVKEMYCDLMAIRGISQMQGITMREREALLATMFAEGAMDYRAYSEKGERAAYFKSRSMILENCLRKGSVSMESGCLSWEDTMAMIADTDPLTDELIELRDHGTIQAAEDFLGRHFSPYTYRRIFDSQARVPDYLRQSNEQNNPYAASQ